MREIGYVRVSFVDQNPKRQLQEMKEIGMGIIYEEKVSGATQDRAELQMNIYNIINSFYYLYFCYFLLQNPYYKDSFFLCQKSTNKKIRPA
ncbi:recombinase family protein, partial [Bacillus mycoides]|uniref:recombinase family protein n=1 Tax=Bacillus mycoides TaxID=1405 RepID=UPI00113E7F21